MKFGSLNQRIAFEPPLEVPDGSGGVEVGWDAAAAVEVRAHFRYLRGGETVQASRLAGRQPVVVTVRNSAAAFGVTPAWRMREVNEGTIFNVRSGPVPSDDRRWLEFTVESGVAI